MYLTVAESRALSRLFGLMAENMAEREVRERAGYGLLDLLRADHFASFIWDDATQTFGNRVSLNMSEDNLGSYETYYQFRDPITYKLQQRRVPTLVTQVMPQKKLMRTEFFNDFLAHDKLHWGVNAYSYVGDRNIGDLRIWRSRNRENFDAHSLELLRLIEPAFTGALQRASRLVVPVGELLNMEAATLSPRELEVGRMVSAGLSDKQIAQRLSVELSTVRTYLKRSFIKLGVHRRGGIAAVIGRSRRN